MQLTWGKAKQPPIELVDPQYDLLVGRLSERLVSRFPHHAALPAASIPAQMIPHCVQHQFRPAEDKWPVVQVGPGIYTYNVTNDYGWQSFRDGAVWAVNELFNAHPGRDDLRMGQLMLRYIDAIDLDPTEVDVLGFLREKLKVDVQFAPLLFEGSDVLPSPRRMVIETTFVCKQPRGQVRLRFSTGQSNGRPSLIWETVVTSSEDSVPEMPRGFANWLEAAHGITHSWFFTMIAGDLHEEFTCAG